MCHLVNKTTNFVVKNGDIIHDRVGHPWYFAYCEGASAVDQAKVTAFRVQNDRPTKIATTFVLSFFPEYRVSVADGKKRA
jgi:hypothetical protein